jgi:hypothetical protein
MFSYPSRRNTPLKQNRIPSFLTGLAVAALGALALASSANAASTACPATTTSTPYAAWGDTSSYWLVPDGDFESQPSGWTLAGGASRVAGSDPFAITGTLGSSALGLPAGSSAESPSLCVEATERTYRFMGHGENAEATVRPELVYEGWFGRVAIPGRTVTLKSAWEPSPILHTGAMLVSAISGGSVHLQLRFTTLTGRAVIDDVFVDPRMRR